MRKTKANWEYEIDRLREQAKVALRNYVHALDRIRESAVQHSGAVKLHKDREDDAKHAKVCVSMWESAIQRSEEDARTPKGRASEPDALQDDLAESRQHLDGSETDAAHRRRLADEAQEQLNQAQARLDQAIKQAVGAKQLFYQALNLLDDWLNTITIGVDRNSPSAFVVDAGSSSSRFRTQTDFAAELEGRHQSFFRNAREYLASVRDGVLRKVAHAEADLSRHLSETVGWSFFQETSELFDQLRIPWPVRNRVCSPLETQLNSEKDAEPAPGWPKAKPLDGGLSGFPWSL